jgi:nucleolin
VKKPEPIEEEEEKPAMEDENDEEGLFEVCVRGLSFQAYDSDIRSLFETCGNVLEVKLLTRDDGKSKGTAFVKFNKKSAFNKALELSGSEHLGRSIIVEESQGKKPFNNGGSFGGNQRGGFNQRGGQQGGKSYPQPGSANIETPTLFIGGLSYNSTADSIRDFFSHIGEVSSARVVTDKETGKVFLFLFSPVVSDMLSSTMWTQPRRPIRS